MIFAHVIHRLRLPAVGITASAGLLTICALLAYLHATSVRDMREKGLPAAVNLPQIERRAALLEEQNELVELQAMLKGGAEEEYLHLYVLPEGDEIDRLVATFNTLFSYLERSGDLSAFSALKIGDAEPVEDVEGVHALPITFDATVTQKGLSILSLFSDLSGLMTIADVLSPEDIDRLLALTEQEEPGAVTALEHFLSADVLRYSEEPQAYLTELKNGFASADSLGALEPVLESSRLREAQGLLGQLRSTLRTQGLWPLRFLMTDSMSVEAEGERYGVAVELRAFVRK